MQPPESPPEKRPTTATALAVGIPAILILASLPFLQVGDGTSIPKLCLFLGRFHPTLVHLPIALLLVALLLEVVRLPGLRRVVPGFPDTVLDSAVSLAALGALAAALAGWLLSHEGGYDTDLLNRHLWSGVATGIGAVACALLRFLAKARPHQRGLPGVAAALLAATCGTMVFAAHAGGSLTHGEGYLTEHAPAPLRRLVGLPVPRDRSAEPLTAIAEREAFDGVALRVFENHCVACHNPAKLKGNLRLDTYEGVLAGGQSGPVVAKGADPGSSELLKRIRLPLEAKGHMPPKGKAPLTEAETALLTWWIEAGAPNHDTLRTLKVPAEIRVALSRILPEGERRAVEELQNRRAAEYEATLTRLRASIPGSLRTMVPGERDLEYTAAIAGATFGDAELQKLGSVGKDLVWLDLSRTGVTDGGLKVLAQLPSLKHLDLRGTAVGDDGVRALDGLHDLEALSLYGTRVTDAGLKALQGLPSLRRVYVGGTRVTKAGLDALRKTRTDLEVTP